jgi:hypothetical protein
MGLVRRGFCSGLLLGLIAGAYGAPARAATFSQATVSIAHPFPNPSDVATTAGNNVVSVSSSGVTLSAQSNAGLGSVGLQVVIPPGGYDNRLDAHAAWTDNWTGSSLGGTSPIGAVITLDGSIDTDFYDAWVGGTTWTSSFSLLFRYIVDDNHEFQVGMNADDTPAFIGASFDGADVTSYFTFTPDPSDPTKMHFALSYTSPAFAVASSGFLDDLSLTYSGDGLAPSIDAIHTFSGHPASADPTVTFASESGRTFGVPEPATAQLGALALAGIAAALVRKRL